MKKLFVLFVIQLILISTVALATEAINNEEQPDNDILNITPATSINEKNKLIKNLESVTMYSATGFKQEEIMQQELAEKDNYMRELGVATRDEGATIETITYGRIIGSCNIDFDELDKQVISGTVEQNLDKIINIENKYFVEMLCRDIVIAYVEINENRIVDFIEPGLFNSEYIKNIVDSYTTIEPQLYLFSINSYVKGFYDSINKKIIKYTQFNNDASQLEETDLFVTLQELDEQYIEDFPRIDYEALEEQKRIEKEKIATENTQHAIVAYSIIGVLTVVLVVVILVSLRKFKNMEE